MMKHIVRFLMKMPTRWMIAVAGGKPTIIEGRTLDPRIQFLGAAAKLQPAIESLPPVECRKFVTKTMALVEGDEAAARDARVHVLHRTAKGGLGAAKAAANYARAYEINPEFYAFAARAPIATRARVRRLAPIGQTYSRAGSRRRWMIPSPFEE